MFFLQLPTEIIFCLLYIYSFGFYTGFENIPGVLVVVEGDLSTVTKIKTAVKQKPPVPVILFEESGGITEILIYAKR